jgi:hypothetical protein
MRVTKDQIIGALPHLSQPDLLAIKTAAGALLQQGATGTQNDPENAQGWLFAALAGVLNMGHRLPDSVKPFNKNAPLFLGFVAAHFASAMHKKIDALAVMTGLLQLLASDLKGRQIPVTYKTMAEHLPRIAEVFELAFPGYLASGLAHVFINAGRVP